MSELSGPLGGVGRPAIVRFLTGLKKTGCLQVQHEGWHGEVFFASGEVRNAVFGSHRGLQALDALIQNQSGASFTFEADVIAPGQPDIELQTDALLAHLESGSTISAPRLPSLDGIPSRVNPADTTEGEEPLPLDRGTLQTLLAIDGARTVREIMSQ